jgi:hypothetical protein
MLSCFGTFTCFGDGAPSLFAKDTVSAFGGNCGEIDHHSVCGLVLCHVDDRTDVTVSKASVPCFNICHACGVEC